MSDVFEFVLTFEYYILFIITRSPLTLCFI